MAPPTNLSSMTHAEKDALIMAQAELIAALLKRIEALEARLGRPRKTSENSSVPPSCGFKANNDKKPGGGKRKGRKGVSRALAENPDKTVEALAQDCPHCDEHVAATDQSAFMAYDHIELPPIAPIVTRINLHRGTCPHCQLKFSAAAPVGMEPGSPFGPNICALIVHLHMTQMVSFSRLSKLMAEVFNLTISEGAIVNIIARAATRLETVAEQIAEDVRTSQVIASDETSARVNGRNWWQWVMSSSAGVHHTIIASRAAKVVKDFLDGAVPLVWVADRYAAQNKHASQRQVCLAHLLRDAQFAIDAGDKIFAPGFKKLLKRACGMAGRRDELQDATLKSYRYQVDATLDKLLAVSPKTVAGRKLMNGVKRCRGDLFVFLERRDVPCTNNVSERHLRPSVIFRKVTGGFRSEWGAKTYADAISVIATGKLQQISSLEALRTALAKPLISAI
jgi:transposase